MVGFEECYGKDGHVPPQVGGGVGFEPANARVEDVFLGLLARKTLSFSVGEPRIKDTG